MLNSGEVRCADAHVLAGMSNLGVARFLLRNGLAHVSGVVYLDSRDQQMILLRDSDAPVPLAQVGIEPSQRFTFYDQVFKSENPEPCLRSEPLF